MAVARWIPGPSQLAQLEESTGGLELVEFGSLPGAFLERPITCHRGRQVWLAHSGVASMLVHLSAPQADRVSLCPLHQNFAIVNCFGGVGEPMGMLW